MKFKTTLVLVLLVAAGLVLFALHSPWSYLPWTLTTTSLPEKTGTRERLTHWTPERLVSLRFRRQGQDLATLDRTFSDSWVTSGNWPANPSSVQPVLDILGSLHSRFLAEVASGEKDLARFGLAPPSLTIELLTREDLELAVGSLFGHLLPYSPLPGLSTWLAVRQTRLQVLHLGEPQGGEYRFVRPTFLRLQGEDEVLRLAPGLIAELARPADAYRQRRLFPSERVARLNNPEERIDRLDARELLVEQQGSPPLRLIQGAEGWELAYPSRDHLDPDTGERLLSAVADLWAEQFVYTNPASVAPLLSPHAALGALAGLSPQAALARTGLNRSTQSLRVTRHDGTVLTLQFGERSRSDLPKGPPMPGDPPPDSFRYAKLASSDLIFEVQDSRLNDIFVTFEVLRDHRLVRFSPDDVESIRLRHDTQVIELLKEKKDTWKMVSPRSVSADNDKIRDLLQKLSTLETSDRDIFRPAHQAALATASVGMVQPLPAAILSWILGHFGSLTGLEQPRDEIQLSLREKARPDDLDRSKQRQVTLRLGKSSALGHRLFLQAAGWPRIDALEDTLTPLLEKPTLAYRGKQVLEFAPEEVARLELRSVGLQTARPALGALAGLGIQQFSPILVTLERTSEGWVLTTPVRTPADSSRVDEVLKQLSKLNVVEYVADEVPQTNLSANYGLHPPLFEVKISFRDQASSPRTLQIGAARVLGTGWFARLADSGDVFALASEVRERLMQPALRYLPSSLWQIDPDDEILSYTITKAGQEEYSLTRQNERWQVTGPFTVEAPSEVIDRLAQALQAPRIEEYREYPATDLLAYGLAPPAVRLTIKTKRGKEHTLLLGKQATTGTPGRFAKLAHREGVFLVSDTLAKAADQSALDFLDRRLLTLDAAQVTSLVRQQGKDLLELIREEDTWKLTKPIEQVADDRKVPQLLRQLSPLRADRILAYKPKDLQPFGLAPPSATVTFKLQGTTPSEQILLLGREEPSGQRVAMLQGSPTVALLSAEVARQLLAGPLAFRNHDLARLPDADVLKLQAGERKITFARPEGTWKVTQPIDAEADHDGLESFINTIARLRADELLADKPTSADLKKYGLDKPQARWQILDGDEVKLDLAVGASEPNGKRRYARLLEPDLIFLLDEKLSGLLVAEYRPRALWKDRLDPAQIERVKFGYKKDPFELEKDGDSWKVVGKPDLKLVSDTVSDTLSALRELKLERYIKDDKAELKLYGLDPPELILEVTTPQGKHSLHLGGLEGTTQRRYARLPSSTFKDVFVLDPEASTKLTRDLPALEKPLAPPAKKNDF